MNDTERLELDRRMHEIVERFRDSPELQNQIFEKLIADGVIDEHGQVICLRNGNRQESSVDDVKE